MASVRQWHEAILAALRTEFKNQKVTVAAYAPTASTLQTPALLLEMEDGTLGNDTGDGRTALSCRLTLHALLSLQTDDVDLAIRDFATAVLLFTRYQQWGLKNVSAPAQLAMGQGHFQTGDLGYESWYVTWEQTIYLGESRWHTDGLYRGPIRLGLDPQTGKGHEGDYEPL